MNKYYPHLYEPLKIGTLTLRNRIVASVSSQNDIEPDGTLSLHNIAYYARKAKGGASLVTVGDGIVHPTGKDHPNQVYLFTDNCLPSLTRCAEEIHKYGAAASYELSHGGIVCNPEFIGGGRPYGPSEMDVTIGFQTVNPVITRSQEMTEEFMAEDADRGGASGDNIVVIGGGLVGVETALHMARSGKNVIILEMAPEYAKDANIRYARTYRWELEKEHVKVICNAKSEKFTKEGIHGRNLANGEEFFVRADTIIMAAGMKPRTAESEALRWCAPVFIPIGNVVKPGIVMGAIRSGFDAAMYQIR